MTSKTGDVFYERPQMEIQISSCFRNNFPFFFFTLSSTDETQQEGLYKKYKLHNHQIASPEMSWLIESWA